MATQKRALVTYLVAAAKVGERDAVSRLAALWYPALRAHAYRLLGSVDDLDDIAQESWIDIQRGLGSLRDVNAFPAWSFRIVSRRVAKAIKNKQRDRLKEPGSVDGHTSEAQASLLSIKGEDQILTAQVRAAMATLSAGHKATLALFYLEELSIAEIAIALDVPKGTVKSRLAAARDALRRTLIIKKE